jgi:pyruvate kinase
MRVRRAASGAVVGAVHPRHRRSAENLVDYLTLRSHDIRSLQSSLAELGLSSLGRAEEHVMRSVEQVLVALRALSGTRGAVVASEAAFGEGRRRLEENARDLMGPVFGRDTRIMVTASTELAHGPDLARRLVEAGMDCARINCAHDGPAEWELMIGHLRKAACDAGRVCPVLMDVPGPKLRTGPIVAGPRVLRLRPRRDARGMPVAPARAALVAGGPPFVGPGPEPVIPVGRRWLSGLRVGDRVSMHDTRGSARTLEVVETEPLRAEVEVWDTTYVEAGALLEGPRGGARVGALAPVEQSLRLHAGDVLTVTEDVTPATPRPAPGPAGPPFRFRIGCSLPGALRTARQGHQVWFDDGRIGGEVRAVRAGEIEVELTVVPPGGANLKGSRGINLPDSALALPAITEEDDATIRCIAANADIVGLSFVQRVADIVELRRRLSALGRKDIGIILKIETARAFRGLPDLLLSGMCSEHLGVMVARGDLAVECGFERLAELQEEILWLCDAGHVPVVWATQVLDQMARSGRPSRAEVSDAVMGGRAECVMLNKGPFVVDAVRSLDDILRRARTHQVKKVSLLRRLKSWSPDI